MWHEGARADPEIFPPVDVELAQADQANARRQDQRRIKELEAQIAAQRDACRIASDSIVKALYVAPSAGRSVALTAAIAKLAKLGSATTGAGE